MDSSCPICQKRKPERFCPAKAEKICAVCCGTEREVSISCPVDCAYLAAAHRYEDQHQRKLPADTPLLDVRLRQEIVDTHQQYLSAIAFTVAKFSSEHAGTADPDVLAGIAALAAAYKSLAGGILYEQVPEVPVQRELYEALGKFFAEAGQLTGSASYGSAKDSEIYQLLVFFYRMGLLHTNGRPRARRFIEYLRGQFPAARELQKEEPRIILP